MSTQSQIAANQANAQHSSGPKTAQGKAAVGQNNFRHGFTGAFRVLNWEDIEEFRLMHLSLQQEHQPATPTEEMLVETMAQSYWLRKRALILQNESFNNDAPLCSEPKDLALYIRYQNTHDRAFYKALNNLLKLRGEKRKQEIGFESQKHKQAEEERRQAREKRKQGPPRIRCFARRSQGRPPMGADCKPTIAPARRLSCRRGKISSSKGRLISTNFENRAATNN